MLVVFIVLEDGCGFGADAKAGVAAASNADDSDQRLDLPQHRAPHSLDKRPPCVCSVSDASLGV